MLRFVRRGTEDSRPLGDYPPWLSTLLRTRGMDTPEKAERFLHPALEQLHPPLMMQDMDRAITLIRRAVAERQPVMIYGDYDVDGVCATSILLETLREEGALAEAYIPSRHGEGYGLNCDAVRQIARQHRLLITVDCGVTNHQEVRLAQMLGQVLDALPQLAGVGATAHGLGLHSADLGAGHHLHGVSDLADAMHRANA